MVAKFKGKKTTHYYIGKIVEENNEDEQMSYCGQFMRKNLDNLFSYPSRKDHCLVDLKDTTSSVETTQSRLLHNKYLLKSRIPVFPNLKSFFFFCNGRSSIVKMLIILEFPNTL